MADARDDGTHDPSDAGRAAPVRRRTPTSRRDRMVTLTDATVAIAMTLLVLPLVDDAAHLPDGTSVAAWFGDNASGLLAFGVTFVVMGSMWLGHRDVLEDVRDDSALVTWATFVWLGAMVLLPLWSQLLWAGGGADRLAFAVYIGTIAVAVGALGAVRLGLRRDPGLTTTGDPGDVLGLGVSFALLLVALVVATSVPGVGMWALLLLVLAGPLTAAVQRRRAARAGRDGPPDAG